MSGVSRFRVFGSLDLAGGATTGTVTIDRACGLFIVRPLRRRKTYALPLDLVATLVCQRIILSEVSAKRREKAARKKARRR